MKASRRYLLVIVSSAFLVTILFGFVRIRRDFQSSLGQPTDHDNNYFKSSSIGNSVSSYLSSKSFRFNQKSHVNIEKEKRPSYLQDVQEMDGDELKSDTRNKKSQLPKSGPSFIWKRIPVRINKQHSVYSKHRVKERIEFAGNCRMSNCFNWSRCRDSSQPLKIHIYPPAPSLVDLENDPSITELYKVSPTYQKILNIIEHSAHHEPNASLACIFVPRYDTLDRDVLSPDFFKFLPSFEPIDEGRNHLIFNLYSGSWPEYHELDFSGFDPGYAILVKASSSSGIYRRGFDISLPLFSKTHTESIDGQKMNSAADMKTVDCDRRLSAQDRLIVSRKNPFLVVFKGKRYIYGIGSETRNFLHHLHNEEDILIYTTCKHGKKWKEIHDERCVQDNVKYDSVDYMSLMTNSTFCLTPRGRRLGSFRFLESLSIGCIPVVLSNDWIKPFSEIIDWSSMIVDADERSVLQIPETLRSFKPDQISRMKSKCLSVYNKYFSSVERIVLTTISILEKRIHGSII